jgi:hypothetical protein
MSNFIPIEKNIKFNNNEFIIKLWLQSDQVEYKCNVFLNHQYLNKTGYTILKKDADINKNLLNELISSVENELREGRLDEAIQNILNNSNS